MHGFNDSALESQQEKVSELLELCEERSRNGQGAQPFSFVELCEVQRKINTRAAVSPLSCVPLALLASVGEAIRITLLCLFNVVFSWRVFPMTWGIIPVVPVPKPGKDKQLIENHRQVSLFESMFKLLDKLLYYRVKFRVNPFLQPWQMGAGVGSDQAAWVLDQILRIRARSFNGVRTWLGFLDGESAFCRPPPAFILTALWECGVNDEVWLFLHQWLGSTFATLLLEGDMHGLWGVQCGVPQGGSLSMILCFLVGTVLWKRLIDAGCGVGFRDAAGVWHLIPCILYVDDVVLLADSPEMLTKALRIASKWAAEIRMRWNVGVKKSAVMAWGSGRLSNYERSFVFKMAGLVVPLVSCYVYLGVVFSCGGGWGHHVDRMRDKLRKRTGQLVWWAEQHGVTLDVLCRLWRLYVESASLYGFSIYRRRWVRLLTGSSANWVEWF